MISLERLKLGVGIDADDDTQDALLELLLPQALADVENRTGHYFGEVVEYDEVVAGLGTPNLWIDSVPDDGVAVKEQAYAGATQRDITDFEVRVTGSQARLVRKNGNVWTRNYEYVITSSRGYEVDGLPPDIEALVIAFVARALGNVGSEGFKSESYGGYSYTKATDDELANIANAAETIARWKRPVIA